MNFNTFRQVLAEFESYGGKGIVYGGCLRDTVVGVGPIKDIDIAVENTAANDAAITAFVAQIEDTDELNQLLEYGNFPDVHRSVQVTRPARPYVVNFVVLGRDHPFSLGDVALRTDFGICQAALDSEGTVFISSQFSLDQQNKTFTYMREPFDQAQFDRSVRRFERLTAEKYAGWRLVIPGVKSASEQLDDLFN